MSIILTNCAVCVFIQTKAAVQVNISQPIVKGVNFVSKDSYTFLNSRKVWMRIHIDLEN